MLYETEVFHVCLNTALVHQITTAIPSRKYFDPNIRCFQSSEGSGSEPGKAASMQFCKPNCFNPSYCRTFFCSFPLPLFFFSSPVPFSRFTVHCHVYIRMHSLPLSNLSWEHSKKQCFFWRVNSISNTGQFAQLTAPLRNTEKNAI